MFGRVQDPVRLLRRRVRSTGVLLVGGLVAVVSLCCNNSGQVYTDEIAFLYMRITESFFKLELFPNSAHSRHTLFSVGPSLNVLSL